jgi:catechol 2,3-dioxygenase
LTIDSYTQESIMPEYGIPSRTVPGEVALTVQSLERSAAFYTNILGLEIHDQQDGHAALGVGETDLVLLNANPKAQPPDRTTGLYHFAIRVPTRPDLAWVLHRLAETQTRVSGFADHQVSEAIYLPDPDGNGIEIYHDRPREKWYGRDGALRMGTDPLDVDDLLAEIKNSGATWNGLPTGTRMGHVHLHVANLEPAIHFYRDILGFDLMMRYGPSAAFLSAGRYHHHVGINTWNGVGAPPPSEDAVGLDYFTLNLPENTDLEILVDHLDQKGVSHQSNGRGIWLKDPSLNQILLKGGTQ